MGANSCLSERVDCYNVDVVRIGDNVVVSQDAFLCTASHDISSVTMELTTAPIVIENNAWVTARAIVMPGVVVGKGAVVATGAVVTRDVAEWSIIGGIPAREIGKRVLREH
jgi:putative colanic acid biosynthesis acetyltransferase WcaF